MRSITGLILMVFLLAVMVLNFWGYPLDGFHFSDFHYYEKELPSFWGLSIVRADTGRVNWEFLYHNEGLDALSYYLINRLPLGTEAKLVFVNGLTIALHLLNAGLFTVVLRRLVGPSHVSPFVVVYLLYPFASANRYWQACLANNLAATFFLASLWLFVNVEYVPGRLARNLALRLIPSLLLLWLSIITVEFAILLSPLFVYLALYYSNGGISLVRFPKRVTPYTAVGAVFLMTSVLPAMLFTGHNLTVLSYAARYRELAAHMDGSSQLVAVAAIVGNAVLVYGSYLFANTVGLILYPLAELVTHSEFVRHLAPAVAVGVGLVAVLGVVGVWLSRTSGARSQSSPDFGFLLVLGLLWTGLAYFPFSLSFGYPRNVGLVADRINVLGSMGVTLCLGSLICLLQDLVSKGTRVSQAVFYAIVFIVITVLLLNIQLQKAVYLEAERKERALIDAVLEARARLPEGAKEPIFLLDRAVRLVSPRTRLRRALAEPSFTGKLAQVVEVIADRYFLEPPVPTGFHLEGIYWFWSKAFEFYADLQGSPRPLAYRLEEPFRLSEEHGAYKIGYIPTEIWEKPSDASGFRVYPRDGYELVCVEIAEPSFRLGGPLTYDFKPCHPDWHS